MSTRSPLLLQAVQARNLDCQQMVQKAALTAEKPGQQCFERARPADLQHVKQKPITASGRAC